MKSLSHVDQEGQINMVDVGSKPAQHRLARASGKISMKPETIALLRENQIKKGDVITTAKIAGIQAAKQTGTLIPLCHPLSLTGIQLEHQIKDNMVIVESKVECIGSTGVEMEALTAVSVALLTVYDMCKSADKHMHITDIKLVEKVKADVE